MSQGQNPEKYSHVLSERKKEWLIIEGEGETAFRDLGEQGERRALGKEEAETFRKEMTHSVHCC